MPLAAMMAALVLGQDGPAALVCSWQEVSGEGGEGLDAERDRPAPAALGRTAHSEAGRRGRPGTRSDGGLGRRHGLSRMGSPPEGAGGGTGEAAPAIG